MGYYMGDFYRGDPGFWSSLWGFTKGVVGSVVPGAAQVMSVIPGGARTLAPRLPAAASATGAAATVLGRAKGMMVKHPVLSAAGAAGALGTMAGMGAERLMTGGACGRGHSQRRPLKHCGQVLKSGKCGKCYRSMNVCNPRALRRAIRRTRGFAKLAMKTIHIVHPKKKGRFGGFKKRKRG